MTSDYPEGLGPDDPTAPTQAHTDSTAVSFKLCEGRNGSEPWAFFEQDAPGLPVLKYGNAFLGLHFRLGVSFEEARDFTRRMERMFDTLSYTKFDT